MTHSLPIRDEFVKIFGACAHCKKRYGVQVIHEFLENPIVSIRCRLVPDGVWIKPNFVVSPEECERIVLMCSEEGENEDEASPL